MIYSVARTRFGRGDGRGHSYPRQLFHTTRRSAENRVPCPRAIPLRACHTRRRPDNQADCKSSRETRRRGDPNRPQRMVLATASRTRTAGRRQAIRPRPRAHRPRHTLPTLSSRLACGAIKSGGVALTRADHERLGCTAARTVQDLTKPTKKKTKNKLRAVRVPAVRTGQAGAHAAALGSRGRRAVRSCRAPRLFFHFSPTTHHGSTARRHHPRRIYSALLRAPGPELASRTPARRPLRFAPLFSNASLAFTSLFLLASTPRPRLLLILFPFVVASVPVRIL